MSVYQFNEDDKVTGLRVYMLRAQDVENVLILCTGGR